MRKLEGSIKKLDKQGICPICFGDAFIYLYENKAIKQKHRYLRCNDCGIAHKVLELKQVPLEIRK